MQNCSDFLIAGPLHSARGVLTAKLRASAGDLCLVENNAGKHALAEVVGFQGNDCQIMPLQPVPNISANTRVISLGRPYAAPVGPGLLGRVVDALGAPIDGCGPILNTTKISIQHQALNPMRRRSITQPFATGQKAIDGLLTIGHGQRVGLFAGSGVGKSTLLGEIAKFAESDVNVVVLVGERGREVRPFVEECLGEQGLRRSIVVVSTVDQPPLLRIRAAQTAIAQASWFRQSGCNVLLMLDSLTRLANAQRELGILLSEPPTSRGYPPSAMQLISNFVEQMGMDDRGSITGLLTVLVEGDDTNEPVADAARSVLDGHIVLDRKLAERSHFPAINIAASVSRLFNELSSPEDIQSAQRLRKILSVYDEVADLLRIGAYVSGSAPNIDQAIQLKPHVDQLLQQQVGERFEMSQTYQMMKQISDVWKF